MGWDWDRSPVLLPPPSLSPPRIDTPNIVVPPEVVAGTEVEVSCMVPDNCPELRPELSWLGHEGLGEPAVLGRLREDEGTWVQVSLLHFVPTREANGHRLGCQASFPNTTLQFEGYASLDVKCEPGCGQGGVGRGGAGPREGMDLGMGPGSDGGGARARARQGLGGGVGAEPGSPGVGPRLRARPGSFGSWAGLAGRGHWAESPAPAH